MKKCYPFLIKIVKNLKNKAFVSLYEKQKKYSKLAKRLPFFITVVEKLKQKAKKSLK
jgi:hypothetical protein